MGWLSATRTDALLELCPSKPRCAAYDQPIRAERSISGARARLFRMPVTVNQRPAM
jgi:hypothetical protein